MNEFSARATIDRPSTRAPTRAEARWPTRERETFARVDARDS